jgi:predicted amidohydrolase
MERRYLAAVAQVNAREDVAANLDLALRLIAAASSRGARIVVLPEYFLYVGPDGSVAFDLDGAEVAAVREAARKHGLFVAAGSVRERVRDGDPRHYNTSLLFGPDGEEVARYRKIHLFDVDLPNGVRHRESETIRPGDRAVAVETPLGMIGMTVCYDLRFPELYRGLAALGAHVLLVPANFTLMTGKDHWEALLRARAIENQAWVLASGQIGQKHAGKASFGRSMIVDPWGAVVALAPDMDEALAVAEIDMDWLDKVRALVPALRHARLMEMPG